LAVTVSAILIIGCAKEQPVEETPEEETEGYRIIFQSVRDASPNDPDVQANPLKYFELYTMKMDGSDIKRITNNQDWETHAEVSPDGKKVLFSILEGSDSMEDMDSRWEIAVMDIDGNNMELLTNNNYFDKGSDWNHDGTKIVYISDTAERTNEDIDNNVLMQYDLYVMDADGTGRKKLTDAKSGEVYADPAFSYNEPSKIVYVKLVGLSEITDLYIMDADGQNKRMIFEHNEEIIAINDPMFSRDGSKIIFMGQLDESGNHGIPIVNIFTINIDGTDLKRITQNDGESDVLPHYSPDGNLLTYYTYFWKNGVHNHQIRTANADGSNEKTISSFPWEAAPSWIP